MTPFFHEPTGRHLKTGRTRPNPNAPRLRAAKYLRHAALPKAPDYLASSPLAQPCMNRMLLNDRLSDCTIATTMKCSAQVNGFAGVSIIYADAQADALYRAACGYDGTSATDNGGDENQVIDYVTAHGIEKGLHHWAGKLSVDGSNPEEVRHVVGLTKNLFFGVELAKAWLQVGNGSVLTKAGGPDPELGHAMPAGGRGGFYTPDGVILTMWGGIETLMPWDVLAEFTAASEGGELHALVSHDMIRNDAKGLAWGELAQDFKTLGGSLNDVAS